MKKKEIKLFEAFAGIGSQHKALNNIANKMNWSIKCVGIIEWFIPAIAAYVEMFSKNKNIKLNLEQIEQEKNKLINKSLSLDSKNKIGYSSKLKIINNWLKYLIISQMEFYNTFDINSTSYKDIAKNIDIFTYSFPCQDLSNQGKQLGMKKGSNTRSGLLWEVERIFIEMKKNWNFKEMPKYLLLENVSQIGNYKNIDSLNKWIDKLSEIGYETKVYYLNSSNFSSPQNRLRAYALSVRRDWKSKTKFEFYDFDNFKMNKNISINSILDKDVDTSMFMNELLKYKRTEFTITKSNIKKFRLLNYTNFSSEAYVYDPHFIGPTLTASGANSRIKILINNNIRKLSAKESLKYMGFTDEDYKKIKKTNLSDIKIIYLAGNSIVINVLEKIFETLRF